MWSTVLIRLGEVVRVGSTVPNSKYIYGIPIERVMSAVEHTLWNEERVENTAKLAPLTPLEWILFYGPKCGTSWHLIGSDAFSERL